MDWRPGKKVALSTALRVCPAAAGLFHSLRFYASAASMHRWLGTSRRGAECTKCGSSPLLLSLGGLSPLAPDVSGSSPPHRGPSSIRTCGCTHLVHSLCLGSAIFWEGTQKQGGRGPLSAPTADRHLVCTPHHQHITVYNPAAGDRARTTDAVRHYLVLRARQDHTLSRR